LRLTARGRLAIRDKAYARRTTGAEERMKLAIGGDGCVGRAIGDAGRNGIAADLASDAPDKSGRVGCVGGSESAIWRDDVVEDAEAEVDNGRRSDLVGKEARGCQTRRGVEGKSRWSCV